MPCHACHTDPCACLARWPGSNVRSNAVQHRCNCGHVFVCTTCPPEGDCGSLCPFCTAVAHETELPPRPSLRALYATRAELAARYTQDKSYAALVSHPPDYAALQAQIQEAEQDYAAQYKAMYKTAWRQKEMQYGHS